jgi:hypothetical protein
MKIGRCILPVLLLSACGLRQVPPPQSAAGYRHVELKDVSALGLHDINVEITAGLGPMTSENSCGGFVVYSLMGDGSTSGGLAGLAATAQSSFTSIMQGGNAVTISLPRARYAEVRDLKPFQRVRVRGYLSHSLAHGCATSSNDGNGNYLWDYLWVDSIEAVPAN